jgi:hypothetical protein
MIRDIRLRFSMATLLSLGLILAPLLPGAALAADGPGVGVSGASGEPASSTGKGALAPPKDIPSSEEKPTVEKAGKKPAKSDETRNVPRGIAASAGNAGTVTASSGGGVSLGWKIAGGVLGVGLLVGLAGGSSGGSGGGTTPSH